MSIYEWRWFAFVATMFVVFAIGSCYALYRATIGAVTMFDIWNEDDEWDE